MNQRIIFFDGNCVLCARAVRFILKRDPKALFSFCSLQSNLAKTLLANRGINSEQVDSLLFLENKNLFWKSTAVLQIAARLSFPWNLGRLFLLFPQTLRDPIYNWIARNRYKWWGYSEACDLPGPNERDRFLE